MALVKSRGLVLRSLRLGETSKVAVCYTEAYGRVRLLAKGGRKAGSRFGAALEPFVVSGVVFYMKPGRDLSLVSQAEIERDFPALRHDVVRMAYGGAILELTDSLVSEQEPDPALFAVVEGALADADSADASALDGVVWRFAFRLARSLGYDPALDACVLCGREPGKGALFAPRLGGLACAACCSQHPEVEVARREATARVVSAAAGSAATAPAGAVLADEVWDTLRAFLEEHSGRRLPLRSLGVLAQLRRAEHRAGAA